MIDHRKFIRISAYINLPWYMDKVGKSFSSLHEAAAYYISTGERRGDWPNPIFDPGFYRKQFSISPDQSCLEHFIYLRKPSARPCQFFDVDWYEQQNPDYEQIGCGILHYLSVGGKQYRNPSPEVDMAALSRDYADIGDGAALVYALSTGRLDCMSLGAVTNNVSQLSQRQREFHKKISTSLIKCIDKPLHGTNLLFVQCAKDTDFWLWFNNNQPRNWDVFLNCYAGDFKETAFADHVCVQNGTKFTGMLNCWLKHKVIFDMYEYVLFIDDDLVFRFDDVSIFFEKMQKGGLDLAQPSLSKSSCCVWPALFNVSKTGIRRTTSVEIMMPALSRRARDVLLPYFMFSVSGFGLDLLIGKIARDKGFDVGVIDDVIVKHEKKIDVTNGTYYTYLRKHFINPQYEMNRIIRMYKITNGLIGLFGGIVNEEENINSRRCTVNQ